MRIRVNTAGMLIVMVTLWSGCGAAPEPALDNTLTAEEKAGGWQLLFDGATMAGWEDPAAKTPPGHSWTIEDGCLKALPKPHIREGLITRETFRDFELVFDWRIAEGGNSGVKYRIQDRVFLERGTMKPGAKRFEELVDYEYHNRLADRSAIGPDSRGQEYLIAFEYQVIDNEEHRDAQRGSKARAGALYDLVGSSAEAVGPVGEFNHSRVVLRGNHVEHWLNGVKMVDLQLDSEEVDAGLAERWSRESPVHELLTGQPTKDCPIALQHHNDEVWFRNIKIRRL